MSLLKKVFAFFAIGFMVSTFVGKKYLIVFSMLPSNSDIKNNYDFQFNRTEHYSECSANSMQQLSKKTMMYLFS